MIETIDDMVAHLRQYHRHLARDLSLDPLTIPEDIPPGMAKVYRGLGRLFELQSCTAHSIPKNALYGMQPLSRLRREAGRVEFYNSDVGANGFTLHCFKGEVDPVVYVKYRQSDPHPLEARLDSILISYCLSESLLLSRYRCVVGDSPLPWTVVPTEPLYRGIGFYPHIMSEFDHIPEYDVLVYGHWVCSQSIPPEELFETGVDYAEI